MEIPTNLKHKPVIVAEDYAHIDGRAAYESGLPWLQEVRNYIRGNMDFTASYLAENIPEVRLIHPEGTYLLWLDMRGLGLGDEELERFITQDAGLWLDRGSMFGPEGTGFQRIYRSADKHSGADFLSVRNPAMPRLRRAGKKSHVVKFL